VRVVHFDPRQVNFLTVGNQRLFLLCPEGRATFLVNGVCPHRGGPLHLGELDVCAGEIQCPWHGGRVPVRELLDEALPLVLHPEAATAILAEPEDALVQLRCCLVRAKRADLPKAGCAAVETSNQSARGETVRGSDVVSPLHPVPVARSGAHERADAAIEPGQFEGWARRGRRVRENLLSNELTEARGSIQMNTEQTATTTVGEEKPRVSTSGDPPLVSNSQPRLRHDRRSRNPMNP
jgi:hypothetical protein